MEMQSTEDVLSELNRKLFEGEDSGSHGGDKLIGPLLADDFRIIRFTGVEQDRDGMLKQVASDSSGRSRGIEDERIRVYGDSAVVVTRLSLKEPSGEISGRFWNTKVFVNRGSGWRCVAWQVTKIQ